MRDLKIVDMKKSDVSALSDKDLMALIEWAGMDGFKVAIGLAKSSIAKQIEEAANDMDVDGDTAKAILSGIAYMRIALNYILNAPIRAKEELIKRKEVKK